MTALLHNSGGFFFCVFWFNVMTWKRFKSYTCMVIWKKNKKKTPSSTIIEPIFIFMFGMISYTTLQCAAENVCGEAQLKAKSPLLYDTLRTCIHRVTYILTPYINMRLIHGLYEWYAALCIIKILLKLFYFLPSSIIK